MTPEPLVQRLRSYTASGNRDPLRLEAADRIEALESSEEEQHERIIELLELNQSLKAALREIAYCDNERGWIVARRVLGVA